MIQSETQSKRLRSIATPMVNPAIAHQPRRLIPKILRSPLNRKITVRQRYKVDDLPAKPPAKWSCATRSTGRMMLLRPWWARNHPHLKGPKTQPVQSASGNTMTCTTPLRVLALLLAFHQPTKPRSWSGTRMKSTRCPTQASVGWKLPLQSICYQAATPTPEPKTVSNTSRANVKPVLTMSVVHRAHRRLRVATSMTDPRQMSSVNDYLATPTSPERHFTAILAERQSSTGTQYKVVWRNSWVHQSHLPDVEAIRQAHVAHYGRAWEVQTYNGGLYWYTMALMARASIVLLCLELLGVFWRADCSNLVSYKRCISIFNARDSAASHILTAV